MEKKGLMYGAQFSFWSWGGCLSVYPKCMCFL